MLYTTFRGNRPTGSREKDVWAFLSITAILSMWQGFDEHTLVLPTHKESTYTLRERGGSVIDSRWDSGSRGPWFEPQERRSLFP